MVQDTGEQEDSALPGDVKFNTSVHQFSDSSKQGGELVLSFLVTFIINSVLLDAYILFCAYGHLTVGIKIQ